MKKLLLITMALLFFVSVGPAKEIEVSFAPGGALSYLPPPPPGETELYWDDGEGSSFFTGALSPYATTFTAPSDCWLVRYRLYWYYGGKVEVDCLLFDDSGGTPTGDTLFTVTGNTGFDMREWVDIDVISEGVTLTSGDVFHPGWSHNYTEGGVLMDTPKQAGSCWFFLGYWYDWSHIATHMVRVVIDDDFDGPYVDGQDPADDEWTDDNSQFVFHAKDDDKGVDDTTIDVSVDDGTKADVPGDLDVTGDPSDYTCTWTPDSPFEDGTYDVTAYGSLADLLGNEMGSDETWSFSVDATAPTVGGLDPADGAEDVDPDSNIIFHIYDPGIGVDTSSIDFTVTDSSLGSLSVGNLALSTGSGALSTGYAPAGDISGDLDINDDDIHDVVCTFDPDDPLPPDSIICTVAAGLADDLGNETDDDIVWTFDIIGEGVDDTTWGQIKAEF